MTPDEIINRLLALSDKITMGTPLAQIDYDTVVEAASFVMEEVYASRHRHPANQTSNGDPVATYWNNIVKIKKAGH